MKLRACFVREVALVLQAAWVIEGPAFIICGKSMADDLLEMCRWNICPQEGVRMVQLMVGLELEKVMRQAHDEAS